MENKKIAWTIMKGIPTNILLGSKVLISGRTFQKCFFKPNKYETHELYIQPEMIFSTKYECIEKSNLLNKEDV